MNDMELLRELAQETPLPAPAELEAARDPRPKRVLVPEHDQFSPPAKTGPAVDGWLATTVEVIPGADHFPSGATDSVVVQALGWLDEILGPQT